MFELIFIEFDETEMQRFNLALVCRRLITAITCWKRVFELLYEIISAQDGIKTQVELAGMKLMHGKTDV